MKLKIARFRTSIHFGKGIMSDAVMLDDPTKKWVSSIDVDSSQRWVTVSTSLDGLHAKVVIPMENVTCFVPLIAPVAQPANGKSAPAMK